MYHAYASELISGEEVFASDAPDKEAFYRRYGDQIERRGSAT